MAATLAGLDTIVFTAGIGEHAPRVRARVLALGIRSDWLFPPAEVRALADGLAAAGADATYRELDSPHGHDAFLKEWDLLAPVDTKTWLPRRLGRFSNSN